MNIFDDCLADGDFDQRWRGLLVRLSGITQASSGARRQVLEDCAIFDVAPLHGTVRPLTVWVDVSRSGRVAITLAGFFEEYGLRCGPINSHSVDPRGSYGDLTWMHMALPPDMDAAELAEPFADWLTSTAQRPVDELLKLQEKPRRTSPGGHNLPRADDAPQEEHHER
jgi:hypothetical protein